MSLLDILDPVKKVGVPKLPTGETSRSQDMESKTPVRLCEEDIVRLTDELYKRLSSVPKEDIERIADQVVDLLTKRLERIFKGYLADNKRQAAIRLLASYEFKDLTTEEKVTEVANTIKQVYAKL